MNPEQLSQSQLSQSWSLLLHSNFIKINPDCCITIYSRWQELTDRRMGRIGIKRRQMNDPEVVIGSIQALSCIGNNDVPRAAGNFGNYVVFVSLTGPITRNCNLTPAVAMFQLRILSLLAYHLCTTLSLF